MTICKYWKHIDRVVLESEHVDIAMYFRYAMSGSWMFLELEDLSVS